jgi:membrane-bound lytic murein transglycosylase A
MSDSGSAGMSDSASDSRTTTAAGFLTGYFEPELVGARRRSDAFPVPLLARPDDLVAVDADSRPADLDLAYAFARRHPDGRLTPYFDRAAIEDGALAGRGLELVWLADPVDAFFVHVQGSCRIRLDDGGTLRLAYDGKAGHPYTSIGRLLIEAGVAAPEAMTADVLARWLRDHPAEGRALMRRNRSYIFFAVQSDLDPALGAVAGGGVPLTPGRSIAVDRAVTGYGAPVWLDADLPLGPNGAATAWRRLTVAQDTGSAIVGRARADLFIGCGAAAGLAAGRIRHRPCRFAVFVPRPNRR